MGRIQKKEAEFKMTEVFAELKVEEEETSGRFSQRYRDDLLARIKDFRKFAVVDRARYRQMTLRAMEVGGVSIQRMEVRGNGKIRGTNFDAKDIGPNQVLVRYSAEDLLTIVNFEESENIGQRKTKDKKRSKR